MKKKSEYMEISNIPNTISFIENLKKQEFVIDKKIRVDFNGGEALLNKKFIYEFIDKAKNYNYKYSITTNGILIDSEIIDLVNKHNIQLQISLDGCKETHDLNRVFPNGDGSFDVVMAKLREIKKNCKKDCLTIVCVLTPETLQNFAESFIFLINNGFTDIGVNPCLDTAWTEQDFITLKKEMEKISIIYIENFRNNKYIKFTPITRNIWVTLRNGFTKFRCDAVFGEVAILPDGKILPCGGFVGCSNEEEFYIGNIISGLDNEKIKFYLKKRDNNKDCESCSLMNRCQNDCLAINNRINKNMMIIEKNTCLINQIFIKETDKIINILLSEENSLFIKTYAKPFNKSKMKLLQK